MRHSLLDDLIQQLAEPFFAEALFDCLPDVVFFVKNQAGQYVMVNQTMVRRGGFRHKGDLIGRRPDEVFPPPLGLSYRAQDEDVLRGGHPITNRLELQRYPQGETGWCLTTKLPLRGVSGQVVGVVGFSRDLHVLLDDGHDYAGIAEAVRLVHDQYDQPLKVRWLAERAGLSEYQFEQRIRKIFQLTPGQLIQKVRMEAALHRLATSDDPIVHVALACGYAQQSSFSRQFKQAIGMSPAEYRRATRRG